MDYRIDLHTHTIASGHAYNTIYEMVEEAKKKGMTHLGITEHAPKMPGTCNEFYFQNLKVVPRNYGDLTLLLGCEANIVDDQGNVDLSDYILKKLDVVIASLHLPCIKSGSVKENTAAIVNAMKNPLIHIIGHPDDGRFPVDYEVIVKAAKDTGTLLEINNNSLRPTGPRVGTRENDAKMLQLCKQYGVSVVLGSDAHVAEDIGNFGMIESLLLEVDFPKELIVNRDFEALKEFLHAVN